MGEADRGELVAAGADAISATKCRGLVEAWERTRESWERAVLKIKEARSEARGRKKEPSWTTTADVV